MTAEPLSTVVPGAGAEEITVVPSPCMSPTVRLLVCSALLAALKVMPAKPLGTVVLVGFVLPVDVEFPDVELSPDVVPFVECLVSAQISKPMHTTTTAAITAISPHFGRAAGALMMVNFRG